MLISRRFFTYIATVVLLLVVLLILGWIGLFAYSAIPISGYDAFAAIWHRDPTVIAHIVVHDVRLPRVLEAMLVGASIAAAGALMQGLTRNPLASPSLFGVNAGAALGMALVSTVFAVSSPIGVPLAAILGGLTTWVLVMILGGAWRAGTERGQLVLAGIAISALCSALTKASIILVEDQAASVMAWLAGSFANVQWHNWQWSWPGLAVGLVVSLLLAPKVNLLAMGDERVKSLGINLTAMRLVIAGTVLILVGISVSTVGALSFVGLIVPHLGRLLVGYDYRRLMPVTMLLGALLTVAADIVSRAIIYPTETPAGAVLAIIGAPIFIYLVRKTR